MPVIADSLRVLVVDDSQTIRQVIHTLLTKAQCDVFTANDGYEALAQVADVKPNIILVDIIMPLINGYQACALIKNNPLFKNTPLILLSSKNGLFDKARGQAAGCDGYLTKPFSRQALLGIIEKFIGEK